jgi:anti-sigma factor RsiW
MTDAASKLSERELADLAALADGSLPVERQAAVEAWVAASPELAELLDRQRRALSATQALAEEPAPEPLRAAVEAQREASAPRRRRTRLLTPRLALASALAVVVAVVAAALLSSGPGAPTVAEAAQLGERTPSGPAPPPAGTQGTQLALDVEGVVFPDLLESYGWRAVGVRRDEIGDRDATTVFYEKDGTRIAYVIVAGDALTPPSDAPSASRNGVLLHTLRVDGRFAVTWRRLGRTCILIGPVPADELRTLASWRGDGTLRY